ncbi:hypothetical protein [Streptomyces sp. NPDC056323]|uniref:hypothetical protein n=1 Tax=unclassified Streptomyces TaxID=2593676 RepID=UPI0035DF310A
MERSRAAVYCSDRCRVRACRQRAPGALVDTALLGNHATVTLAAFAVAMAVSSPATATVAGALRGVMPTAG